MTPQEMPITGSMPTQVAVDPKLSTSEGIALAQSTIDELTAEGKAISTPNPKKDRNYFRAQIGLRWNRAFKEIMAVCHLTAEARIVLPPDEWRAFIEEDCPFDYSKLCKMLKMAESDRLNDPANEAVLPKSVGALLEVMLMEEKTFRIGIERGIIHPKCTLADLKKLRAELEKPKRKIPKSKNQPTSTEPPVAATPTPVKGEQPEPHVGEAAVKTPLTNRGLRLPEQASAADVATATASAKAPTIKAAPLPLPKESAETDRIVGKNRITVYLTPVAADNNRDQLQSLREDLGRLVAKYSFIETIEILEAA